jgi:hypothetical protein
MPQSVVHALPPCAPSHGRPSLAPGGQEVPGSGWSSHDQVLSSPKPEQLHGTSPLGPLQRHSWKKSPPAQGAPHAPGTAGQLSLHCSLLLHWNVPSAPHWHAVAQPSASPALHSAPAWHTAPGAQIGCGQLVWHA